MTVFQRKENRHFLLYTPVMHKRGETGKCVRPDRDIFRCIIVSIESGRDVNIDDLLQKELCVVRLSLATTDFALKSTNKAELASILGEGARVSELDVSNLLTCTIVDGMALVRAMGKPQGISTFGDYVDEFIKRIKWNLKQTTTRVDITFDQYFENSIKDGTRSRQSSTLHKVRTIIGSRNTKLPTNWKNFIEMNENKANLANFLSEGLAKQELDHGQDIFISGGFNDTVKVVSIAGIDVTDLQAAHEEADTCILLHAADASKKGCQRLIIHCRDADVLVMLLVFAQSLSQEVWMRVGTSKKLCYIKVHEIKLPMTF